MQETESQIAKIVLGNNRASGSFVFVMAEKAPQGDDEIYMVADLPVLNPAAQESCERICLAIASAFKKAYRGKPLEVSFENALALVNEELGKLTAQGQTGWVNKLNCVLASKNGQNFNITTCGKTSAFLLRDREFTDISCAQDKGHPLKTFENFASGKIRLNDLVILSTVQLFNHISMDRLSQILNSGDFLNASKTIIELLKQASEPSVSFGVILNLQTLPGVNLEENIDLENYTGVGENKVLKIISRVPGYIRQLLAFPARRKVQTALPNVSMVQKIRAFGSGAVAKGKGAWRLARTGVQNARTAVNVSNFKAMTPVKKFFAVSVVILLLASIFSIYAALNIRSRRAFSAEVQSALEETQKLLSNSQSSLLYQDEGKAAEFFQQALAKYPKADAVNDESRDLYNAVGNELQKTRNQLEKVVEVEAENLGNLAQGQKLIQLPAYLVVQTSGQSLVSFNKETGKIEDSALKTFPSKIVSSAFVSGNNSVVYDGSSLMFWNYQDGSSSKKYTQSVPAEDQFAGLVWYQSTGRVYVLNKQAETISSLIADSVNFSNPLTYAKNSILASAVDLTIDGNVYVLGKENVSKFQKGILLNFSLSGLVTPLSGSGKIYTHKDFTNLYILDAGNNRILVVEKNGRIGSTLKSSQFTALKDFEVDEKNRTIYLLNDGSLLKVKLP